MCSIMSISIPNVINFVSYCFIFMDRCLLLLRNYIIDQLLTFACFQICDVTL